MYSTWWRLGWTSKRGSCLTPTILRSRPVLLSVPCLDSSHWILIKIIWKPYLFSVLKLRRREKVICQVMWFLWGLPRWLSSEDSACNAGDTGDVGLVPGSGRSPGGRHGNPLQYSCLENPMDRGTWRAAKRVVKSWTWLKGLSTHARKS